jgi:flavorubredoxin
MKAIEISPGIYWVGAVDWDLRNFHGYMTQSGSSYNAYLILDETVTLVDTVKAPFTREMLARISSLIDPAKIQTVVANHVEMDHSGALPALRELNPDLTVVASAPQGEKGLKAHYGQDLAVRGVKSGDELSLGRYTLRFFQAPMVHWPDNMMTYVPSEKLLFSNDAFGQHLASSERFVDDYPMYDIVTREAKKYYANIVLPYSVQVKKALDVLAGMSVDTIAPSHGLVWRGREAEYVVGAYHDWSANRVLEKAVIIYDTMWHSTEAMAYAVKNAFVARDIRVRMMSLQTNHMSDIMTELADAKYMAVGSPTLNSQMMPAVAGFLTYMRGLAPKGRHALAFGSYGWGGQGVQQVQQVLEDCRFTMLHDPFSIKYIPAPEQLKEITNDIAAVL